MDSTDAKRTRELFVNLACRALQQACKDEQVYEDILDREDFDLDTSELDEQTLKDDPRMQEAFTKFINVLIGTFEFAEENE